MFNFIEYREFLRTWLKEETRQKKGAKARLAAAIGCQPSYLSQVLKGTSELSLEQADRANQAFAHSNEQSTYFLLLVAFSRAGTPTLKKQLLRKIKQEQNQYWTLKNRLKPHQKEISEEAKQIYYSSWQYAAFLMALTVPSFRTRESLVEHFGMSEARVSEILEFLVTAGFARSKDGVFTPAETWLHIGSDSIYARRDDLNWRLRSIQALEEPSSSDLRYSSVLSLSKEDFGVVRSRLIQALEEVRGIVKDSKEEKVCSLIVDFFEV